MPLDFSSKQVVTTQLIASGGFVTGKGQLGVLIYSRSKEEDSEGSYPAAMLSNVGLDAFMFVSGVIGAKTGSGGGAVVFGGDTVSSGAMYFEERNAPPSTAAGTIALYGASDGSVTKLYFQNEDGAVEIGSEGSGGAPTTAQYVTLATNGSLSQERVLTSSHGGGLGITDGGAGSNVALSVDISSASDGTGITVATSDLLLLTDVDDNRALKRITVGQLPVGSAAGSDTEVQFNNSGQFAGDSGFTYNSTTNTATLTGGVTASLGLHISDDGGRLQIGAGGDLILSSSSDNGIIGNATSNKDIIFRVNDGGVDTTVMTVDGSESSLLIADEKQLQFGNTSAYIAGNASAGTLSLEATIIETDSPVTASKGIHIDSDDASLQIGAGPDLILSASSDNAIIGNATSDKDIVFRINDGGIDTTALMIDGSEARVGIGITGSINPSAGLHVSRSLNVKISGDQAKLYLEGGGDSTQPGGYIYWQKDAANNAYISYLSGTDVKNVDDSNSETGAQMLIYNSEYGADFAIMNRKRVEGSNKLSFPLYISASATSQRGDLVLILSGGAADSWDPRGSADTSFFVSGAIKSKAGESRGTAVFGGDVVTSGAMYFEELVTADVPGTLADNTVALYAKESESNTKLFFKYGSTETEVGSGGGGGASAIGWTGGPPGQIHTTGSLGITGSLTVGADGTGADVTFYGGDSNAVGVQWDADGAEYGSLTLGATNYGIDFQVFGDSASNRYLLWDQSADQLKVLGSIEHRWGDVVFNEGGSTPDFRIESDTKQGAFLLDGGTEQIGLLTDGTTAADAYGLNASTDPIPADTALFVSGAIGSRGTTTRGTSTFGGDMVVSGTLFADKIIAEVDQTTTGSLSVSGSLVVSQSATIHEGLIVNEAGESDSENNTRIETGNKTHAFFVDASTDQVLILSGGAADSTDEATGADVNFYVSGTLSSKDSESRGLSLFGGDLVVSGNTYALGSRLYVAQDIMHHGDADTKIAFSTDTVNLYAGGLNLLNLDGTGDGVVTTAYPLTASAGISLNDDNASLQIGTGADLILSVSSDDAIIGNKTSDKDIIFRVNDGGVDKTLVTMDASTARVGVLTPTPNNLFEAGPGFGTAGDYGIGVKVNSGENASLDLYEEAGAASVGFGNQYAFGFRWLYNGTTNKLHLQSGNRTTVEDVIVIPRDKAVTATGRHVSVTGSLGASLGMSGSLTRLADNTSYMIAGAGISITSESNGAVTITNDGTVGDITAVTAGTGLTGGGTSGDVTLNIDDSVVATLTGSQFSGNVGITGSFEIGEASTGADVTFYGKDSSAIGLQWDADDTEHGALFLGTDSHGVDFKVYGESSSHWLHWDQSINTFNVRGKITHYNGDVTLNEGGGDYDFRVESENKTHALFIDASTDQVLILSGGATTDPTYGHATAYTDTNFFVSGTIGSKNSSVLGTSVFGGDLVTSGTSYAMQGLSGSLTRLTDGTSYLIAGSGISITSASNGAVTLASDGTTYTAGDGLDLSGTEFSVDLKSSGGLAIDATELAVDNKVVATLTGSQFSGNVGITGSLGATTGLSGSLTQLTDGTSYLIAGSNVTITSASNGAVTVAATDTNTTYTAGDGLDLSGTEFSTDLKSGGGLKIDTTELAIDDTIVATLTGSQFSGNVGVTGSLGATTGLSGSLTQLTDGTSYLIAGSGIAITSASNGAVTIANDGTVGDITGVTAGTGLTGGGTSGTVTLNIDNTTVATLTGSQFSGNVGITGSLGATTGLSGSLTQLTDGTSYLIAGSNVTITSASNGAVTIVSADTNTTYTAGDGLDLSGTEFSTDLKTSGGLKIDSTELAIDNTIVATLTGSQFSGNIGITGSVESTTTVSGSLLKGNYITGSLTQLNDGSSYLIAGSNVQIVSGSSGAVTISATDNDTTYTAGDGLDLSGTEFSTDLKSGGGLKIDTTELAIDDTVVATLTGSQFSGNLGVTGSIGATLGLSGSLTQLTDGSSYLIAGSNVTITSASNGAVTIASTGGGGSADAVGWTGPSAGQIDTTGSLGVSGSLAIAQALTHIGESGNKIDFKAGQVLILSGGSADSSAGYGADTNFFVSGTIGSRDSETKGTSVFGGDMHVSGAVNIGSYLAVTSSTGGTEIDVSSGDLTIDVSGDIILDADGDDIYFRAGADDENGLRLRAQSSGEWVALASSAGKDLVFTDADDANEYLRLDTGMGQLVVNDNSKDIDFRVESNNKVYGLFVDANADKILILSGGAAASANEASGQDVSVYVSGTVDAKNGTQKGITLFGGDIHISGNLSIDGTYPSSGGSSTIFTDGGNKAKTTGSISIDGNDQYAASYGSDIFFYVSGSTGNRGSAAGKIAVFRGDTVVSGALYGESTISGSQLQTATITSTDSLTLDATTDIVLDVDGDDIYFRAGTSDENGLKFHQQSNGEWAMMASAAGKDILFTDAVASDEYLRLDTGGGQLVVNDNSKDIDFRVESNSNTHMIFVDAGNDKVGINTSSPQHALSVVGAISASLGLSGSLTKLVDGTSYLIAGSNVTITSASNGAVTIAGSGAAMDITSGSTTVSSIDSMDVSKLGIVQDLGSGDIAITGSIGVPEDGTYGDGLFTDFVESTPIGTMADRFNEVLKALAPSPAPALDDVNSKETGTTTLLSFGASNDQSGESPPYISVGSSAGIEAAVDVNGSYAVTTSSNNIRVATFAGATHISGVLNADVSSNSQGNSIQNYPAFSFGDGDTGVLRLVVNGSTIKEIDFTSDLIGSGTSGLGTGSYVDGNGSGFNFFSTATTGTFSNGNAFNSFKHRTGQYVVAYQSQRDGWNYARVQHVRTGSTQTTNYIEWVNDSNADALAAAGESISFTGSGSVDLSGISYYRSGTATYKTRVTNAYKYTYDSNDITFTTANNAAASSSPSFSLSDQSKPTIDTGAGETQAKVLHLTSSATVSATYFLSGAVTASVNVTSPLKSNLSSGGSAVVGEILMYDSTDTNTALSETFMSESYRLQSGSFSAQADVTGGSLDWDSSVHMTGSNTTYLDGLQYYRDRLYSPLNTTNDGDFSTFTNAPSNPDYSGISGLRSFYRKFQNTSGGSVRDISYIIAGDGTIEDTGTSVGANDKFRVFFKLPSNGTDDSGWMDAASAFTYNETGNDAGCYIGTFTDAVGTTNYATWGTGSIANNEYIVAKVETDSAWTGYLNSMTVAFGAVGNVTAAPNVDNVDVDTSGTEAKLSFGSSLALTDYTNVGTTAGNSAVDANGTYAVSGNRYGVYGPTISSKVGTINETTTSPGNSYPADAFGGGNANTGSLKLEVNGSVIQTTDLATFINGSDLNGDGSGFTLTTATPGEDSSDLPDYTKFYRTGTYTVVSASQTDGWNYARVTHTVTGSDYESTYVEWVNDISNPTISLNNVTIGSFGSATTNSLSGIKYFISPSGSFRMRASNVYKYVYSSNASAISFPTTTNSTITDITGSGTGVTTAKAAATSTTLPSLNTGVALAYDYDLFVTGTFDFDQATSIPGGTAYTATVSGRVNHPLQGNTTTSSTQSNEVLAATISDTSTTTSEPFTGEAKRLIAGSYTNQSDVVSGGNAWDSTISLDGGNASYNTGLAVYNGELASPQNIGLSGDEGDFRDVSESGQLEAPAGNPDYSSLTNSTREYIRYFTQTAAGSKSGFDVTITGTGTIVTAGTSLSSNNKFNVFFKLPNTDAGFTTGWMDLATAFATGQYDDDDGCLSGALTSSITSGATNTVTFGVKSVDQNEYIVIKIVADKTWTGNIETVAVSWS